MTELVAAGLVSLVLGGMSIRGLLALSKDE